MKDYFGYKDKVCVVTGAASGMGKATTEMLLDLGAVVYALDWAEVTAPVKKFLKTNLAEKESIDAAFKEIPNEIDKFFGIAGVSGLNMGFNKVFTINMIANKYITEEYLLKRMKDNGAVAYMGSGAAIGWDLWMDEYKPILEAPTWEEAVAKMEALEQEDASSGYTMSKRAVCYYSKKMVVPFGERGIRVNCVNPGGTKTPIKNEFTILCGGAEVQDKFLGVTNRYAEPREMAEPIVFFNSDMASYITAGHIMVDDGCQGLYDAKITIEGKGAPYVGPCIAAKAYE